jgi:hypothetical protein
MVNEKQYYRAGYSSQVIWQVNEDITFVMIDNIVLLQLNT